MSQYYVKGVFRSVSLPTLKEFESIPESLRLNNDLSIVQSPQISYESSPGHARMGRSFDIYFNNEISQVTNNDNLRLNSFTNNLINKRRSFAKSRVTNLRLGNILLYL